MLWRKLNLLERVGLAGTCGKQARAFRHRSRRRRFFEPLENRVVLTAASELLGDAPAAGEEQAEGESGDGSFQLTLFVDGQQVAVPGQIGDLGGGSLAELFTSDATGEVFFDQTLSPTLGEFFEVWRTNAGAAGNNPDAVFTEDELLGNSVQGANTIQMFVNGTTSEDLDQYAVQDGDRIILVFGDNPVVSLNTNFGSIVIELFATETPGTVDNFLNYVNDGDYLNSIFHRSDPDFVIQGGGFTTDSSTFTNVAQFDSVPTDPPIANEPGISNLRGTVAMAKLNGDPNSATSQFFVNLDDSNSFLDSAASNAFTVFGQVLDMTTVDAIEALPINTSNAAPFSELPVASNNELVVIESIEGQGQITGIHFLDADQDGTRDSGEQGVAGVTIFVDSNQNGQLDANEPTTITEADGTFLLMVDPGQYDVRAIVSSGRTATTPSVVSTTVEIGRESSGLAFGEVATPDDPTTLTNSISGHVYVDADGNGIRDLGEQGIPGVLITLTGTSTSNNEVLETTLTDDSGRYEFTQLPSGTFRVTENHPYVMADGLESSSTLATTLEDAFADIDLDGTGGVGNLDFGEAGLLPQYTSIAWFLASTPADEVLLREVLAQAEESAGNPELAQAIRSEAPNPPVVNPGENSAPLGNADAYSLNENTVLTVTADQGVLANDTDADGDALTAILESQPSDGSVTLGADGSFAYTPTTGFTGSDSFTYRVSDGQATSSVVTVTLTVEDLATTFSLEENSANGTLVGQLDLPEGLSSPVIFQLDQANLDADLELLPDDHLSGELDASVVLIEYLDLQCPICAAYHPVVESLESQFAGDLLVVRRHLPLTSIHFNAFSAAVAAEAAARQGQFEAYADLLFDNQDDWEFEADPQSFYETYAQQLGLNLEQFRSDQSDQELTDRVQRDLDVAASLGASSTPTFFLNGQRITNPVITDGESTEFEALIQAEIDGNDEVFSLDRETGQIRVADSSALDFESNPSQTFIVVARDQAGGRVEFDVTVDLINVNETAPTASADNYQVEEDDTLTIAVDQGVLANDDPADSDVLTATLVQGPQHGTLNLADNGSFTYTPDADFAGNDSFTYQATGALLSSSTVTVSILVTPVNDLPTGGNDAYSVLHGETLTVSASSGVLANDSDIEDDVLTVSVAQDVSSGVLTLNDDGSFQYVPETTFVGTDQFTYTISDGIGSSSPVTVQLTVTNTPPQAADDAAGTDEDTPLSIVLADLLSNDQDADGDTLQFVLVAQPQNGSLVISNDGLSAVYTPDNNFAGEDSFVYEASDGFDASQATVTITVTPVNDAPTASGLFFSTPANVTLQVNAASGLLSTASDVEGDGLSASVVTQPSQGTLVSNADGSFEYQPNANFHGVDTFEYVVSDGDQSSDPIEVIVTVNTAPVAADDAYNAVEDITLDVDAANGLLENDSDADNDTLNVFLISSTSNGTLNLNSDGSFTYVPDADFNGTDSFTYQVNDGFEASAAATVQITVAADNDPPVAASDAYTLDGTSQLVVEANQGVLANDTDVDGPALSAVLVDQPDHGTITLNSDGSFTYVPDGGFADTDSFTYQASDGSDLSAVTEVVISVDPVDLMQIRVEATSTNGTPLSSIEVGESFLLNVLVSDLRSGFVAEGVFAAYADLLYDTQLVSVDGPIEYIGDFTNGRSGNTTTPGLIDEAGAFAGTTGSGSDEVLMLRIPMVADATGNASFSVDPADNLPANDGLLFGLNDPIGIAQISYVGDELEIIAASGEGESSAFADAVDELMGQL